MELQSKLPTVGTTIFSVMSALARKHEAINLSQGFPNYSSDHRLLELTNAYMQKGYNQYAPMIGVQLLRERIVQKVEKLYGAKVHPEQEITITVGATEAIFTAITAVVHPGDEVIIIEPAYDSYQPAIELAGGKVICYELAAPDYRVDWEKMAGLVSEKTRMIIINTPQNPTGKTFSAQDMEALRKLVRATNILILSDEVYEHLIYDGREHQSVLRYPDLWERSFVSFSFGKTFHNTGWRIGYCLAPAFLMKEFRKVHQFNVFSIMTPIQHALADFLEEPASYMGLSDFYQQKRDFLLEAMEGSRFRPLACEGTYFCLFDYSEISEASDVDFAKQMTTDYGVAAIPVSAFYANGRDERVIRLCFAKTEEVLEQAGELLQKV
ncbi:MAG: methionine aminotransferase [Bacteroidota bacterium]